MAGLIGRPFASEEEEQEEQNRPSRAGQAASSFTSNALKGISKALMQNAFEKFGRGFTDTGHRGGTWLGGGSAGGGQPGSDAAAMAPWREAGATAASALEQRWQQMEYEDFQESEVAGFIKSNRELVDTFTSLNSMLDDGQYPGPDGSIVQLDTTTEKGRERLLRYRSELFVKAYTEQANLTENLTNASGKFHSNRLIQEQIMKLHENSSQSLTNAANPQERIQAEKSYSDIGVQERDSRTRQQTARTAAKAGRQAKRPQSPTEVSKHADWGDEKLIQWKGGTPEGTVYMTEGQGASTLQSVVARARQRLIDKEGFKDEGADHPETQRLDQKMAENYSDDFMEAVLLDTQQNQPEAYRLAEMMYPHMFAQPGDEPKDQPSRGLIPEGAIPEGRISKKRRKGIVDTLYKTIRPDAEAELKRYARDEGSSTDINDAMAHMQRWLEENVSGGPDSAAAILTRGEVVKKEMEYLRKNWAKISDVLKETNLEQYRKQQNIQASQMLKRARKRGPKRGLR